MEIGPTGLYMTSIYRYSTIGGQYNVPQESQVLHLIIQNNVLVS